MDERIETCPVCKGWGVKQLPVKDAYIPCDYCRSEAMQLITSDYFLTWDIPSYIDFKIRKRNRIKKIVYITALIIMLIIAILLLLPIINGI